MKSRICSANRWADMAPKAAHWLSVVVTPRQPEDVGGNICISYYLFAVVDNYTLAYTSIKFIKLFNITASQVSFERYTPNPLTSCHVPVFIATISLSEANSSNLEDV